MSQRVALVTGHEKYVARLHGRQRRDPRDRLGDAVREVTRTVVGAELAAHP